MVDFDRVYYHFDSSLKKISACKVIAILFGRSGYSQAIYLLLQTPTHTMEREYGYANCRLYATAEDALQATIGNAEPIEFPTTSFDVLFPAYCKHIRDFGYGFAPTDGRTYVFDGRVTPIRADISYLTIDKQGCHVCIASSTNSKKTVYLSKEDCIRAEIEGIQIVEFADEPAPAPAPAPESAPAKPKIHTLHFVEL